MAVWWKMFSRSSRGGYLAPKLIDLKLNDWLVYLVSGLVWGLWHAPYYLVLLPDSAFGSMSREAFLLTGCVVMVAWSVMYTELYRLARSVWPCVLMHAVKECVPELLVASAGVITFSRAGELWFHPTIGIAPTMLFLLIGLGLRSIRVKKETVR